MKKLIGGLMIFILCSCGNADNNTNNGNSGDSIGVTNSSTGDTVKHPSGVDNSSVISTDTAAINIQNTIRKADSLKQ